MLAPTLPDLSKLDREALQALLRAEHQERIATQQRLLSRESEIEHLKLLLSQLRRMQFGRKSEKLEQQIEQLELRLEDLQQAKQGESTPQAESELSATSPAIKPARRPLPGASAANHTDVLTETDGMPGLRRRVAQAGRRRFRGAGVTCQNVSR